MLSFARSVVNVVLRSFVPECNVLFAQSRKVLLTLAGWGVGIGPTLDEAERARPASGAEESQEEANHAAASRRRDCLRADSRVEYGVETPLLIVVQDAQNTLSSVFRHIFPLFFNVLVVLGIVVQLTSHNILLLGRQI